MPEKGVTPLDELLMRSCLLSSSLCLRLTIRPTASSTNET